MPSWQECLNTQAHAPNPCTDAALKQSYSEVTSMLRFLLRLQTTSQVLKFSSGSHPAAGRARHTRSRCSIACPFPLEAAAIYSPYRGFKAHLNAPHSSSQQHTEQDTPSAQDSSAAALKLQHGARKHPPPLQTGGPDWPARLE